MTVGKGKVFKTNTESIKNILKRIDNIYYFKIKNYLLSQSIFLERGKYLSNEEKL